MRKQLNCVILVSMLLLALSISACSTPSGHTAADPKAPFDQQFIDMMAAHHEGAIAMARVAQQRAERPEIKGLADSITGAQHSEITQMKAWRRQWFGSDETPPMDKMPMLSGLSHTKMGDMAKEVKKLETANPFDQAFIDAMIPHHEDAIEAAKLALKNGQRPEIKQLAQQIITDQEREISQMKEWRKAWYGK